MGETKQSYRPLIVFLGLVVVFASFSYVLIFAAATDDDRTGGFALERAQIGGSLVPPFCPFDEFDGEDEGDREGDGGEPVGDAPVGVSAELPVVREPRVGALNGPSHPEGRGFRFRRGASFAFAGTDQVVDAGVSDEDSCWLVVVATVEVEGVDVGNESTVGDGVESGSEQDHVMPVRSVDGPPDRDPVPVRCDRPFPSLFPPVGGVAAGSLPSERCLVLGPVDRDFRQVQPDDLVVAAEGFFDQCVEDPGIDPFVTSVAERRL